jgi:hypothetical protein
MTPCKLVPGALPGIGGVTMAEDLEVLNTAVSLLIKATVLAARFSGRVRG